MLKLSELKKGERGRVVFIGDNSILKKRLLDMGITKGVEIFVKQIAPFGDPITVELRGYQLCLRKTILY